MNVKIVYELDLWSITDENDVPLTVRSFETYEAADKYCVKKGWNVIEIVED